MSATTYINGDLGEYTGETQTIHGGLFYNVLMKEGRKSGQILVTARRPDGFNWIQDEAKKRGEETAKGFAKLSKLSAKLAKLSK